jgi:hypothetical protein
MTTLLACTAAAVAVAAATAYLVPDKYLQNHAKHHQQRLAPTNSTTLHQELALLLPTRFAAAAALCGLVFVCKPVCQSPPTAPILPACPTSFIAHHNQQHPLLLLLPPPAALSTDKHAGHYQQQLSCQHAQLCYNAPRACHCHDNRSRLLTLLLPAPLCLCADKHANHHQQQLPCQHAQPCYNAPGLSHQGQRVCQLEGRS